MHQLAPRVSFGSIKHQPVRKETLDDGDLQMLADFVHHGIRQGIYPNIVDAKTRDVVLDFLRGIASKCEFRHDEPASGRDTTTVAALMVYTVQGVVVGFAILSQAISASAQRGIELLMFGVLKKHRGQGHGAAILDSVIRTISQQCFNLIVKCPENNQVLLAMLLTRGFSSISQFCSARVLRLSPAFQAGRIRRVPTPSLHLE